MRRKYLELEVTQRDIDKGCRTDTKNCPIARAARRVLRVSEARICVDGGSVSVLKKDLSWESVADYYPATQRDRERMWKFVKDFDGGHKVRSIKLRLKLYQQSL